MDIDTGITTEVYTIKSKTRLIDIFNDIIGKKSSVTLDYINSLDLDKDSNIIVVGTYFTGLGIVKKLSKYYNNITLIDIYPHLEELLYADIGGELYCNVKFSSNLDLIYTADVLIDTTGFGGLTVKQSSKLNLKGFIIEDPVAEDNDELLKNKNNIHKRLEVVNSLNKAIVKTKGIYTKTSGTMTLTIGVLTDVLNKAQNMDGVLYSACEMTFYEEIIFKERNIEKFMNLALRQALKISTINPFDCDKLLKDELDKIHSEIIIN